MEVLTAAVESAPRLPRVRKFSSYWLLFRVLTLAGSPGGIRVRGCGSLECGRPMVVHRRRSGVWNTLRQ